MVVYTNGNGQRMVQRSPIHNRVLKALRGGGTVVKNNTDKSPQVFDEDGGHWFFVSERVLENMVDAGLLYHTVHTSRGQEVWILAGEGSPVPPPLIRSRWARSRPYSVSKTGTPSAPPRTNSESY